MNLFPNTRAKRNTAFTVLLVWLFALASGIANACLLEARGTHGHAAATGFAEMAHAPAVLARDAGVVVGHGDDSDTSKAPCLKVCDDGSQSLPTQHSGVDLIDPGLAPVVAVLWAAAASAVSAPSRLHDWQLSAPGQPFRVRYSRLAL